MTAGTVNYDGQITVQAVHSGGDTGEPAGLLCKTAAAFDSSGVLHQSSWTHWRATQRMRWLGL